MKKLTLTLALILSTLMSFSQTKDSEGHTLVNLWKTFYKAQDADKPQDQVKALDAIKQEATTQRLAWDFYDAAQKYVDVRRSINWKDRSAVETAMEKEINDFGEPVAVFYYYRTRWGKDKLASYVKENKAALQATHNPEFAAHDGNIHRPVYSSALRPLLKDDYEYALWSIYFGNGVKDVQEYYGEVYPQAAFIEYSEALNYSDYIVPRNLESYVRKYDGKAVSLLGRQWLLNHEFSDLRQEKDPTSAQFVDLRERCAKFEKDRAAFKGDEKSIADCCTNVESLIETLDSKDIDASAEKGVVTLSLRNIKSLRLTVENEKGKQVWSENVTNKVASYYVRDEIKVKLPVLDDGSYIVNCKGEDEEISIHYDKYTLAMAIRATADGYGAYVAEYDTGKPISKCDFILLNADREEILRENGIALDGFTSLPAKFQTYLNKDEFRYYYLRAAYKDVSGRNRLTQDISTHSPHPGKVTPVVNTAVKHAVVLTDRGAYNPGEIMKFKAIFYIGTYEYELAKEGTSVKVELFDPQSKKLGGKLLKTNALGAIAGEFELTGGDRGGIYRLEVSIGGSVVGSRDVRVDEFVLPTFEVTWDKDDTMYFYGDEVRVSGKVASYSGHNLGSVKAHLDIEGYDDADIELNPDGTFSHTFKCSDEKYYSYSIPVRLTVTDDTGETLEFNNWKHINHRIPLSASLLNGVRGRYTLSPSSKVTTYGRDWIIRDDFARINFSTEYLNREGLKISYLLKNEEGKVVLSGTAEPEETKDLSLASEPSGLYTLVVKATAPSKGKGMKETEQSYTLVKAEDDDTALDMDVSCFFKDLGGEDIALQVGATDGPVWVAVELIGSGNVLLEHQVIHLRGERGKAGSLQTVSYKRKPNYPETLTLNMIFFRDGNEYEYHRTINLPIIKEPLKLEFTRFTEIAAPGDKVSLLIQTTPDVECAAAVFDKATETIRSNRWSEVSPYRRPEPYVSYSHVCGCDGIMWNEYPMRRSSRVAYKASGGAVVESVNSAMVMEDAMVAMEAVADEEVAEPQAASLDDVKIRENFGATMAWEPFLKPDADGKIDFTFEGADRLSTYYVQLFAHGEGMKNATLRREMKVTIPVKVSIVQPLFLYGGDEYTSRVTLSSSMEVPVSGRVSIRFYDGEDYKTASVIATKTAHVTIPAGGSVPFSAPYDVPADVQNLGVLVNFVADNPEYGSDAVFVSVPVKVAEQTLTEAHSAVLLAGQDREALIAGLRAEFVNVDGSTLQPVERDILAMIREAIPDSIEPKSDNVLALTEAYYANVIARNLGAAGLPAEQMADILKKIAACQNKSGGIAWFDGMESSPIVTAAVLQRIAAMPGEDLSSIDVEAAVKYLDKAYFDRTGQPWWCGSISMEYYVQTRALFPSVTFKAPAGKTFRQFKKDVKEYLVPAKARGLNAQILAKARRLRTLQSLAQIPGGKDLAKNWGIRLRSKITKSLDADVESLLQYSVKHRSGGCYYPNAVMPWRGLLESELYAHALLCDLFTNAAGSTVSAGGVGGNAPRPLGVQGDSRVPAYAGEARDIAEGIRLWIMIQKETQQWEKDAAYIEAISCVLRGTPETLATKVILLSSTFTKPFPEVKAAGNGFTVKREFTVNGKQVGEGDSVKVGDRVLARYVIWSEENRSFVRLTAHRPASMRPVAQLSGHIGWWLRPMSYGSWNFTPQGYRNVLADKTEYWFDTYPEENTTITEEFFVTQEGAFQMPAIEIESLYAPHYRANDNGRGPLVSK